MSIQKYRKELTPNITFEPNKIFVRKDLFEKIIKSCKATNLVFLKLKEKLGLCIYEEIFDEQEYFLMSEKRFIQHDVENEILNENENENIELRNEKVEMRNEKVEMKNEKIEIRNEKVELRNEKLEMTNENKKFKKIT